MMLALLLITLEQLLSSAFPSALTAAEGKLAWVENARGARNIWAAEPPGYRARQVTAYTADDGQEIDGLVWTSDARSIVFARGGAADRAGEIPNPTSDPKGAEQAIWMVPASGGEPRRLAEGHSPTVQGSRIVYLLRGQIWGLEGAEKPTQWVKARGTCSALRWSPDGRRLAFVSSRGDHSFIAVYDTQEKTVRFLSPGVDRDLWPAWSPDGRRIAFVRQPAEREAFMFGPKRAGPPWSIRVAEVAGGEGREIWRAEPGRGSVFHNIVAENQIFWAAGNRIVFPWERDGWSHLYSVPAAGGKAALLTPGDFEVEYAALAPGGQEAIYNSNQDDIDRRHIWRVAVDGGRPAAVTRGSGIEWEPVAAGDGLAFLRSDARRPARAAILVNGRERDLNPAPDFSDLVEPQAVTFPAADGMEIRGQLFVPRASGPRPAVLFFHGGSRRQMLLGWHYGSYYHNAYAFNQYLASRGYVVLSVNYRSGIGYGMEFREALNYGATGASEFHDVLGAGLYLRGRAEVDPKRIALWGGSYGGYLTALGLARASHLFAAGVDVHGVHDWNVVIRNFIPSYDPERRQAAARLALESSPMASIKGWRSPVLLIHGDDDRNVPFSETVTLAEELRKQGVEFEQLILPDEVHGFLRHASWLSAFRAAAGFLDRKLK